MNLFRGKKVDWCGHQPRTKIRIEYLTKENMKKISITCFYILFLKIGFSQNAENYIDTTVVNIVEKYLSQKESCLELVKTKRYFIKYVQSAVQEKSNIDIFYFGDDATHIGFDIILFYNRTNKKVVFIDPRLKNILETMILLNNTLDDIEGLKASDVNFFYGLVIFNFDDAPKQQIMIRKKK
jgi:hypothetical protein